MYLLQDGARARHKFGGPAMVIFEIRGNEAIAAGLTGRKLHGAVLLLADIEPAPPLGATA